MKIAFTGYQIQDQYNNGTTSDEDTLLFDFLKQKGLDIEPVIWNDSTINWEDYQLIILKSPWDYHEKISEFFQWLDHLKSLKIKLLNNVDILQWNADKHYLKDISDQGFPVVPSLYAAQNTTLPLSIFDQLGTNKIVIKPCISAGAKNTIILEKDKINENMGRINKLFQEEDYLIQPFQEEIKNGELSFIFFGEKYSHSALKIPKENDFRVQHYHGGTIEYPDVSTHLIAQAQNFINAFAADTLYARVDGIVKNGLLYLMELELIEPYLFLNNEKLRLENYYVALQKYL